MNLEQKKFEEWKRRHGKLNEGFLDGNDDLETADVPSEDAAAEEEKDLSEEPSEDDVEGGDEQPETDSVEEGGDNSVENLDDFGEGKGEAETQTDDGVKKEAENTTELKDVLTTLTTAVQALTDKIDTMNAETGEEGGEEAPAEGDDETAMDDFGSEEGGEEASADETSEEGEGGEGESTEGGESEGDEGESSEGGEGESTEGGEGETSEEAPADETKSENFNFYHKKGQPLDEDSDYIIGKLYEDRFDKLEPFILSALKMKIRNHIEEYKKQVRIDAISKKLEK